MKKVQCVHENFDQTQQDFVALTSHQLRTPLSATSWFLEILLKEIPGKLNDKQRDLCERAYESNMRMITLVKDLLDISRLDSHDVVTQISTFSLTSLIRKILKNHEGPVRARNCKVELSVPKRLTRITTDKTLVQQILENLIHNGLKYSAGKKCHIRIEALEEKQFIVVKVADEGIGISAEDQRRIFDRFFRAENAKTASTHGTGLGLFLSKHLANILGGDITFVSALNKGSTFSLRLPKKRATSSKKTARGL